MVASAEASAPTSLLVALCGQLAPIASIVVFLAPLPTIRGVVRVRSIGHLPLLPYSSMVASAFLWLMYGIMKREQSIWFANGVGFVLGCYYTFQFTKCVPNWLSPLPTLPGTVQQHMRAIGAVVVVTLFLAILQPVGKGTSAGIIGNGGVLLCVAMFASPLAALRVVLQTKSAKAIPLPFTIASVVNCLLWVITGLFQMKDANIYVPNILGLCFGLIQVYLKVIYGSGGDGSGAEGSPKKGELAELNP